MGLKLWDMEGLCPTFLHDHSSATILSRIAESDGPVGEWELVCDSLKPMIGRTCESDGGSSVESASKAMNLWVPMVNFLKILPCNYRSSMRCTGFANDWQ